MKFHILSNLHDEAWGGGNQFQKALKKYLNINDLYSDKIRLADVVLVNSHHWGDRFFEIFLIKKYNSNIIFLHRVDGPISTVRSDKKQIVVDKAIMRFNKAFADGTIYQSKWSRDKCIEQGMDDTKLQKVIHNAPDPSIFYKKKEIQNNARIHLVAASWSSNERKGFDIYKFLDENLDFSNYSFTFIGNSPIVFNNIKHIPAMTSEKLAEEFRKFDLFLHPSHIEACSNILIEAMHCGLVPIAMNNTSHPEIIKYGGLLFDGVKDVLKVIDQASSELQSLKELLNPPKIDEVGSLYIKFAKKISEQESNDLTTPSWGDFCFVWIGWQVMRQKLRLQSLCSKLGESIRNIFKI